MSLLKLFDGRVEARPAPGVFEPAARGAFRVLGLTAAAARGEVFDASSSVRLALKLGVRKAFESDAQWLFGRAAREESDVRDAVGRLSEPAQRARERLFWFHARTAHAPVSNVAELTRAVDALLVRVPFEAFNANGSGGDGSNPPEGVRPADEEAAALHDAALLALCGVVRLDPALRDGAAWARALDLWRRVFACEEFWSLLVAADLKGDYEQPVTFGEVAELRRAAPRVVVGHVAVRAGATARRGALREATKALRLLRGAGLPAPLMHEYENEVVGPVEDDLVEKLNMAFTWTSGLVPGASAVHRNRCNLSWRRFETLRPRLVEFAELAGADSYAARRVFEHAASKLLRLAVAFDEAAQRQEALFVCYTARLFAPPGSEELPAIDAKLLALGVVEDARERSLAEYAGGVMGALTRAGAPPKLFRDDPKGEKTLDSFTSKSDTPGCLTSVAFWLALVVACVGLRACGVINMRSTRTPINSLPPFNLRPNLNYNLNLNYNVPPPLDLRPYNDPLPKSRRRPGGKSRRQPLDGPLPPPTTTERAPNVNASPPR